MRGDVVRTSAISAVKFLVTPVVVLLLRLAARLSPFETTAAVVCAAVPTAKTAYVLAGTYKIEERAAGVVVSVTTLVSIITLLG